MFIFNVCRKLPNLLLPVYVNRKQKLLT